MQLKRSFLALLAMTGLVANCAAADQTKTLDFTVTATIPAPSGFTVTPEGNWHNTPLAMTFDPETGKLKPTVAKKVTVKGTEQITAKLASAAELVHNTASKNKIPISIQIGGKTLSASASQEIANKSDAGKGKEINVVVSPTSNDAYLAAPGDYTAVVGIIFETTLP
ncbi:MAG TPA: CS1 type fimbrial major subunit [Dyella sp.]|uniref:CS1 type fimbrial major subunit n=1 Tax=Dyella sp. TaxID=1869338 RepID=UPI002F959FDA